MKIKQVTATMIVLIALFGGAFVLYLERETVNAELNNLKLIPMPERFTELYFENPSTLPKQIIAKKPISFAFTIHNLEGVTTTYPYTVFLQYPSANPSTIVSNTVTIADNASTTITISYVFPESNRQVKVGVDLTSLNQSIDFLLPNEN
jgi:hypothetical protein